MTILLTGGSGRLGGELRELIPEIIAPPRAERLAELAEPMKKNEYGQYLLNLLK